MQKTHTQTDNNVKSPSPKKYTNLVQASGFSATGSLSLNK
jgi:hypothetical protein